MFSLGGSLPEGIRLLMQRHSEWTAENSTSCLSQRLALGAPNMIDYRMSDII